LNDWFKGRAWCRGMIAAAQILKEKNGCIMMISVGRQSFVVLVTTAFAFLLFASAALADPVTPTTVTAGTSPTLTINSSGFFDLSKVTSKQISISPASGVSNLQLSNATPASATVTFTLSSSAPAGARMLVINTGDVNVSLKFTVQANSNKCTPSNCRLPRFCDENDKCVQPLVCNPRCHSPQVCVKKSGGGNVCETPQ
jgi:hypothetical protein